MAEAEPKAIDGEPTPEPPLTPSEVARKINHDPKELYREVSGAYEAKQEREAARPRQPRRSRAPAQSANRARRARPRSGSKK